MAAEPDPAAHGAAAITATRVCEVLAGVIDPELNVSIVDMGLVYGIDVEAGKVRVRLTLTSPGCPVAGYVLSESAARLRAVPGILDVELELVWSPPWSPRMMSRAARDRLCLGDPCRD